MKKKTWWILLAVGMVFLLAGCTPKRITGLLTRTCMIEGCKEKTYKEGLCQEHYRLINETETSDEELQGEMDEQAQKGASEESLTEPSDQETEAEETAVSAESQGSGQAATTLEEEIRYIRDTYAYANNDHSLRQKNGYDGDGGEGFQDGFSYYDTDGNLIKLQREDKSSGIKVDAYYINPALGRKVPEVSYLDTIVVFAFATDANGGEYRLYFSEGNVIRYIGPDKQVVDYPYPGGINWMEFSINSMSLSGSEQIHQILMLLSPTWYIPYETGDDDFFEEDPSTVLNVVNKSALESILSREFYQIYLGEYAACDGEFTKEYVREAAWEYLYGDYYNTALLVPEEHVIGQYPYSFADSVYYNLDKVNTLMENIYGISRILAPGDVCHHLFSGTVTDEISLEVSGNRVTTPRHGGDKIDPFVTAEITAYSFNNGYLDVSGNFIVESGAGPISSKVSMTARFKANPKNEFPYQLLSCFADAG